MDLHVLLLYQGNSSNDFSLCRVDGKGGVVFDVLFGPAYKGISLGAVTAAALYRDYGVDVGYSYNRKEAKDHGEGGMLLVQAWLTSVFWSSMM